MHASAGKLQIAVSLPWHVLRCTQHDRQAYPHAVAVLIEALHLLAETLCLTLKEALDALNEKMAASMINMTQSSTRRG